MPEPAQGAEEAFPDGPLPPEEEKKAIRALMDAVPPYRGPSAVHVLEVAGAAAALEHEAKPYAAEGVLPRKDRPAQDPEPHGFQILGEDEEENDPEDEIPEDEGEIDDYQRPGGRAVRPAGPQRHKPQAHGAAAGHRRHDAAAALHGVDLRARRMATGCEPI